MKDIYQLERSKLYINFITIYYHNHTTAFFQKITETHCHFTRSAANQNYFVPRVCSSLGKRNVTYQVVVTWSSIPQEFENFSYGRFSKSYRMFLVALYNT